MIVDAGEGTKNRKKNLITRASKHEEKLKLHEDKFKSKYDDMSESVISELSALNNIIIDHIIAHEKFNLYLKNIFEALQQYAGECVIFLKQPEHQNWFTCIRFRKIYKWDFKNVTENTVLFEYNEMYQSDKLKKLHVC